MRAGASLDDLRRLAADLRLLLLDVDGVMTDGGIVLVGADAEAKRFDVHDGIGVAMARAAGIKVGIVTSRSSAVVERRARELSMDEVVQGAGNKLDALDGLLRKHTIAASQTAYIGDDVQDVPIMRRVGIAIAVQNAMPVAKESSVYVTAACGGYGAVREAVEWLLELRGEKDKAYHSLLNRER